MRKSLIIILIILILSGLGYFVTKKSFDKNALKNDMVIDLGENIRYDQVVTETQGSNVSKIDEKFLGYYFSPHAAISSYLILKNDGTFIHTGRFDGNDYPAKLKGKFSIENSNLKLVYDDKYKDLVLQISIDDRSGTIYIKGQGDQPNNYSGYYFIQGEDEMIDLIEIKKPEVPTSPKTNITTTYMCEGRVKIVRVQDSPSLPPRVSYLRVSDNASIASYGDFGAYIRPEYFSIDRSKIEEGYSFNEINFCKYLKN